jgi:hypothetical protein
MTLNEFRRHPAYDYYIITLVSEGGFVGIFGLSKKLWHKYVEVERKYKTDTDKMTASDYTHLFGYLNPYYRAAYSIPKRKR